MLQGLVGVVWEMMKRLAGVPVRRGEGREPVNQAGLWRKQGAALPPSSINKEYTVIHSVPRFLTTLFAATLLFLGGLQGGAAQASPSTSCPGQSVSAIGFSEDFSGTSIDSVKWDVDLGNGSISVANGVANFSLSGGLYPVISTKSNPFPNTGNYSIYFKVRYLNTGSWYGAGLVAQSFPYQGRGSQVPASFYSTQVWGDLDIRYKNLVGGYQDLFGPNIVTPYVFHEYETCVIDNVAIGFVDGSEVGRGNLPSGVTGLQALVIGNSYVQPLYNQWAAFEVDAIEVRNFSGGGVAAVTSVTPTTASLDTSTIFTITGTNLTSGMGFAVENCEQVTETGTGTSTSRSFQCIPRLPGAMNVTVKTAPGGTVLYQSSAPATTGATPTIVFPRYSLGNPSKKSIPSVRGVAVLNGNYFSETVDMTVPGKGMPFVLGRSYNSQSTVNDAMRGGVGASSPWRFSYDLKIAYFPGSTTRIFVPREDGSGQGFFLNASDNLWYPMDAGSFDKLKQNGDGTFTLYTKGSLFYNFQSLASGGLLTSISDRDGNVLSLTYNANSKVSNITDAAGRQYAFTYDANNRLTRVDDFSGRNVRYTYTTNDADARIATFADMRGGVTTYTYNADNLLATVTDPRGNLALTIAYDAQGRVSTLTDPLNRHESASLCDSADVTVCFQYGTLDGSQATTAQMPIHNNSLAFKFDGSGRLSETIDHRSFKTRTTRKTVTDSKFLAEMALVTKIETPKGIDGNYATGLSYTGDGCGNLDTVTDPLAQTRKHTWTCDAGDNKNLLTQYTNEANSTHNFGYTATGNVQSITNPRSRTTNLSYTGALVSGISDPKGNASSFAYNASGYLTSSTDPYNKSIQNAYDSLGRVTGKTDKQGNVTSYTYDAHGNRLTVTDAQNNVTSFTYDANDNLTRKVDARGNATDYTYDALNRLTGVSVAVGGQTYTRGYSYDAMGRLQTVTNENGHAGSKTFDEAGNVLQQLNPLSRTITYAYDKDDNVTRMTDAEGNTVDYGYDSLDRVTSVTDQIGNVVRYDYTPDGKVSRYTDAKGRATTYGYDAAGNLTSVTDAKNQVTGASYDDNDNLATVTDPNGKTASYVYDKLNRLVSLTDANNNSWSFTYDFNGNQVSSTAPDNLTTTRQYDSLNRLTNITYPDSSQVSFTYDANGNRLTMTDAGGATQYAYDALNRLASVTDSFGKTVTYGYDGVSNLTTLGYPGGKSVTYGYDGADRLSTVRDWLNAVTSYTYNKNDKIIAIVNGNGTRAAMQYDDANRLTGLVNTKPDNSVISSHQLTLDNNGNITNAAVTLPLLPTLTTGAKSLSYDSANRILSAGSATYSHDTAGRIIAEAIGAQQSNYSYNARDQLTAISGAATAGFIYNGDRDRISRTINGATTRYLLDPRGDLSNVLGETDAGGNFQRYYIHGQGLVSQIDASGQAHYYHFDPTGHTLALTDAGGAVSDSYAYTPFGETSASGATVNPFRYVGKLGVMDDGNGLVYMRARYFKPSIARFMSLDALLGSADKPQSLNRYAYVMGNPVMGVDPSGLDGIIQNGKRNIQSKQPGNKQNKYLELGIHSEHGKGFGHAWLTIRKGKEMTSIGLWPDWNDTIEKSGLSNGKETDVRSGIERDIGEKPEESRYKFLTWEQYLKFDLLVSKNHQYSLLSYNCSSFAAEIWDLVTGEHLSANGGGVVPTPENLGNAITYANSPPDKCQPSIGGQEMPITGNGSVMPATCRLQ